MTHRDIKKALKQAAREAYVAALREGRRQRSVQFKPKRGPGSYKRKAKYRGEDT